MSTALGNSILGSCRSYFYYCPSTGDRYLLPVNGYGHPIQPSVSKQLRVRPDGGMGPIPLDTGWTLGPVPKHIAAWALAARRAHAADQSVDLSSSLMSRSQLGGYGASWDGGRGGGSAGGSSGGSREGSVHLPLGNLNSLPDPVLGGVAAGMPAARLPLVPGPDETFVSRDTGITGESIRTSRRPPQGKRDRA